MKVWNQKFSEAYKELLKRKQIKNKSHLARLLGTYSHQINKMVKGTASPTVVQLTTFINHYKLNANFFFGKSSRMFEPVMPEYSPPNEPK